VKEEYKLNGRISRENRAAKNMEKHKVKRVRSSSPGRVDDRRRRRDDSESSDSESSESTE